MSSNTLAGERRWATSRKSGMTVLGKVTVPKPLNLPSQRLENHGMDPNVAIVPKGTLSWGSRGSSSSSDAKNSSLLSSNADGSLPSLSQRPSSGGSATRPSTAGSDRTREPVSSAWGSNSRPSSAAGTLSSNQTPLSSRPRSAETRPDSSQQSRFVEPVVKSSAAWGASITAERLVVKQDGFSLHSGDFPTLGSEREDSLKNIENEDQRRPISASGTSVQTEKDAKPHTDVPRGSFSNWRVEDSQGADDVIHPPYHLHTNAPPQHLDQWWGPPVNSQDGLWDRAHPRGPQFRPAIGPNGFPMEPFPYYRPQLPPPHLASSRPVPPADAAPSGPQPQPKNGNFYRPHIYDTYPRPGVPFRPSFYPGPQGPVPFEGYYGPPQMPYEQDFSFIDMGAGHPAYDGYTGPRAAPNLSNLHGRAVGYGSSGKPVSDKVEADRMDYSYRRKGSPSKYDRWDLKTVGENWEDRSEPNMLYPRKDCLPTAASLNKKMGVSEHAMEDTFTDRIAPTENLGATSELGGHFAEDTTVKLGKAKIVNDRWGNKSAEGASFPSEPSQVPLAGGIDPSIPSKDSALIQKIEGLNAKIRVSDVRNDASITYKVEERRIESKFENMKIDHSIGEGSSNASESFKTAPIYEDVPVSHESMQPVGPVPRRPYHDGHGGDNYRGKGKFNSQGADGWRRKTPPAGSSSVLTASNTYSVKPSSNPMGHNFAAETFEKSMTHSSVKDGRGVAGSHDDSANNNQRMKMREPVKQRALQREKEDRERSKEPNAKAAASEELNQPILAGGESENQKSENILAVDQNQRENPGSVTTWDSEIRRKFEDSRNLSSEMQQADQLESEAQESLDTVAKKMEHQLEDIGIFPYKITGHEKNQKVSRENSLSDDPVPYVASEAQKDHIRIGTIDITLSEGPIGKTRGKELDASHISNAVGDPAKQQQRTNNYSENRNKPDVTPSPSLPVPPLKNENKSNEILEPGSSLPNVDSSDPMVVSAPELSSLPGKESQSKVVLNQRRIQPSRRMPRGQQANRSSDKLHGNETVVWAPVRTQNKAKEFVETNNASSEESVIQTRAGDNKSQNSLSKTKRADMERYVTKAVVKELVQQGTIPRSSLHSSGPNESSVKEHPPLIKSQHPQPAAGSVAETNTDVNGRHNKRDKELEVWSGQLIAADSSHTKPGPAEDVEQSKELKESMKGENLLANSKIVDGSHTSCFTTSAPLSKHLPGKDQGMGRGKRQHPRGSRPTGNNSNSENISGGDNVEGGGTRSVSLDVSQADKTISSKEIQNSTERSYSQWKPKSNSNSASRVSVSESVATEVDQLAENDHVKCKAKVSKHDKETDKRSYLQQVQTVQSKPGEESITGHHRKFNKENKSGDSQVRHFSPNEDPTGPGDTQDQHEYDRSSVSMKNRNQSNRSFRGHKSHQDWSSSHNFRAHYAPPHTFRERQRQNLHYEYQPVDPSKSNQPKKVENPAPEGPESVNRNYHDRGSIHSKRGGGNFYRHQRGAAHVDFGRN